MSRKILCRHISKHHIWCSVYIPDSMLGFDLFRWFPLIFLCFIIVLNVLEQLKEFATRLEASGITLDDISDEAAGSTSEAVDQAIYQSSAHLLSMFLEKLED